MYYITRSSSVAKGLKRKQGKNPPNISEKKISQIGKTHAEFSNIKKDK